ncbi:hypothetical protein ABZW26_32055 [Streptomyces sp. NPDC004623]|uniref:hypothetical protein n=1 Tax=Streptomyces sp. NPDC004623 TaxID=3156653 RepID=UPI0033B1B344
MDGPCRRPLRWSRARAYEPDPGAPAEVDAIAAGGDDGLRAGIRRWCRQGSAAVAEGASRPLGHCVVACAR